MGGDFFLWFLSPIGHIVNNCIELECSSAGLVLQTGKCAFDVHDAAVGINKGFKPGNSSEEFFLSLYYLFMTVNAFIGLGMPDRYRK